MVTTCEDCATPPDDDGSHCYCIAVEGHLDPSWADWFGSCRLVTAPGGATLLAARIRDQAALHGLLTRIRDLGLPLLFVHRYCQGSRRR